MNLKTILISGLILASAGNTFAAKDFLLGSGVIDGTSHFTAKVELSSLKNSPYTYDITCVINDPTGDTAHMKFAFSIGSAYPIYVPYKYDNGQTQLVGNQYVIKDNATHTFSMTFNDSSLNQDPSLNFQWIAGADMTTPVSYSCSAAYAQVNKK